MRDGIHSKQSVPHCCGTCLWFNGEIGDREQFCDELETTVSAEEFCCNKWKEKYEVSTK